MSTTFLLDRTIILLYRAAHPTVGAAHPIVPLDGRGGMTGGPNNVKCDQLAKKCQTDACAKWQTIFACIKGLGDAYPSYVVLDR